MMNKALIMLCSVALLSSAVSCRVTKEFPPTVTERETVTETLRDTTIVVLPDTASVEALLRCDSTNRVLLEQLDVQNGNNVSAGVNIKPHPDGSATLAVDCRTDSLTLEIELRDREIERLRKETRTVLVPREPAEWQKAFITIGILFTVLLPFAAGVGIKRALRK